MPVRMRAEFSNHSCAFWLTTCLLCAEARALPSSVQLRVAFISSTSSFSIFSFWASCWLLWEPPKQTWDVGCGKGGANPAPQPNPSHTLALCRSSSFSSASFWLLSSMPSNTCFIFFTSSWSFWLLIWRSATQWTNSDVSLMEQERNQSTFTLFKRE